MKKGDVRFMLRIGRKSRPWSTEETDPQPIFQGNLDSVQYLYLDSEEKAHEVARLANLDCYTISKYPVAQYDNGEPYIDTFKDERVFATADIVEYEVRSAREWGEWLEERHAKAKRINELASEYLIATYSGPQGEVYEVVFQRGEAKFNPKMSKKIQYWLRTVIKKDGKELSGTIHMTGYLARGTNRKLKKRFSDDVCWKFPKELRERVLGDFDLWLAKEKEYRALVLGV